MKVEWDLFKGDDNTVDPGVIMDEGDHEIEYDWTFWYVYTLSHNEKKK